MFGFAAARVKPPQPGVLSLDMPWQGRVSVGPLGSLPESGLLREAYAGISLSAVNRGCLDVGRPGWFLQVGHTRERDGH